MLFAAFQSAIRRIEVALDVALDRHLLDAHLVDDRLRLRLESALEPDPLARDGPLPQRRRLRVQRQLDALVLPGDRVGVRDDPADRLPDDLEPLDLDTDGD